MTRSTGSDGDPFSPGLNFGSVEQAIADIAAWAKPSW